MINFQAKYIEPSVLLKKTAQGNYKNTKAALVELDPTSRADFITLKQVNQQWAPMNNDYISDIFSDFSEITETTMCSPKFWALTSQQENFSTLNPDEIQCVAEFNQIAKNLNNLYYIQSKKNHPKTHKYILVGETMLSHIKGNYPEHDIKTFATDDATPFYIRNGFIKITQGDPEMLWCAPRAQKQSTLRIFG